ncbi:hypothetical protein L0337_02080 [candidate division KSB1 bacterium]|nr:hypothetical protein [candidate division KSB1 bacterium]
MEFAKAGLRLSITEQFPIKPCTGCVAWAFISKLFITIITCELNLTLAASFPYITKILFPEVGFNDAEQSTSTQPLASFDTQAVL